jgi:hypothetical protein
MRQQILDNKITVTIGQLLKLAPDVNMYSTTTNKQSAPNEGTTSKAIVTVDAVAVNHQMIVIVMHVRKNMVDDVLLMEC